MSLQKLLLASFLVVWLLSGCKAEEGDEPNASDLHAAKDPQEDTTKPEPESSDPPNEDVASKEAEEVKPLFVKPPPAPLQPLSALGVSLETVQPGESQKERDEGEDGPRLVAMEKGLDVRGWALNTTFIDDATILGDQIITVEYAKEIIWWAREDLRPTKRVQRPEALDGPYMRFSPSGERMGLWTEAGVIVFDSKEPEEGRRFPTTDSLSDFVLTDELLLVQDEALWLWSLADGALRWRATLDDIEISDLLITPSQVVAWDHQVYTFALDSGEHGLSLETSIKAMTISPDGRWLASHPKGEEMKLEVRSLLSGEVVFEVDLKEGIRDLCFVTPTNEEDWALLVSTMEESARYSSAQKPPKWTSTYLHFLGELDRGGVVGADIDEVYWLLDVENGRSLKVLDTGELNDLLTWRGEALLTTCVGGHLACLWDFGEIPALERVHQGAPLLKKVAPVAPIDFDPARFRRDRASFKAHSRDQAIGRVETTPEGVPQLLVGDVVLLDLDQVQDEPKCSALPEGRTITFLNGEDAVARLVLGEEESGIYYFDEALDCVAILARYAVPKSEHIFSTSLRIERGLRGWSVEGPLPQRFLARLLPDSPEGFLVFGEAGFAFLDPQLDAIYEEGSETEGRHAWLDKDPDYTFESPSSSLDLELLEDGSLLTELSITLDSDYEHSSGPTTTTTLTHLFLDEEGELKSREISRVETSTKDSWRGAESTRSEKREVRKRLFGPSDTLLTYSLDDQREESDYDCAEFYEEGEEELNDPCCKYDVSTHEYEARWTFERDYDEVVLFEERAEKERASNPECL